MCHYASDMVCIKLQYYNCFNAYCGLKAVFAIFLRQISIRAVWSFAGVLHKNLVQWSSGYQRSGTPLIDIDLPTRRLQIVAYTCDLFVNVASAMY